MGYFEIKFDGSGRITSIDLRKQYQSGAEAEPMHLVAKNLQWRVRGDGVIELEYGEFEWEDGTKGVWDRRVSSGVSEGFAKIRLEKGASVLEGKVDAVSGTNYWEGVNQQSWQNWQRELGQMVGVAVFDLLVRWSPEDRLRNVWGAPNLGVVVNPPKPQVAV